MTEEQQDDDPPPSTGFSREQIAWTMLVVVVALLGVQILTTVVGERIPAFVPDPQILAAFITTAGSIYIARGEGK